MKSWNQEILQLTFLALIFKIEYQDKNSWSCKSAFLSSKYQLSMSKRWLQTPTAMCQNQFYLFSKVQVLSMTWSIRSRAKFVGPLPGRYLVEKIPGQVRWSSPGKMKEEGSQLDSPASNLNESMPYSDLWWGRIKCCNNSQDYSFQINFPCLSLSSLKGLSIAKLKLAVDWTSVFLQIAPKRCFIWH